jgi:hypothetical protein
MIACLVLVLLFCDGAAMFKFDCSEQESQYYMEGKLYR